jgi:hypothetical protein
MEYALESSLFNLQVSLLYLQGFHTIFIDSAQFSKTSLAFHFRHSHIKQYYGNLTLMLAINLQHTQLVAGKAISKLRYATL